VSDSFRAHVNLIFAIGAKYSHLVGADWAGNERDHVLYMTRAVHLLGLKNSVMFISEPEFETVQAVSGETFPYPHLVDGVANTYECLDWHASFLLPSYRPCKSSMDHDRCLHSTRTGSRSPSSERRPSSGTISERGSREDLVDFAISRVSGQYDNRKTTRSCIR
jgi:hypothetical protein